MHIPGSEDLSPQSPERVLGLVGGTGSESDFGRREGTSPLCLQEKHQKANKGKKNRITGEMYESDSNINLDFFFTDDLFNTDTMNGAFSPYTQTVKICLKIKSV